MSSIYKDFNTFVLSKKEFYIPLLIISILGYGFSLFNRTIGWDDLMRDHYFGSGHIQLSGRWGMVAWVKLLGFTDFDPFVDRFTALLLLLVAAVLFCMLLYSIKRMKSALPYTITACAFVSYPLVNELWEYCGANFFMTGGLALSTLTIFLLRNNEHNIKWLIIAGLLLVLPISSYESAIFYYLAIICVVIFLENLYLDKYRVFKIFIKDAFYYAIPVVIAFIIRVVVGFIINSIYGLSGVGGGATGINWFSDSPFLVLIKIAGGNFLKYILAALVYFPITEFLIALIVFVVAIFFHCIMRKKVSILFYGLLVVTALYSQAILQGTALPYRTAQTLTLFVTLVLFLIAEGTRKICNCWLKIVSYTFLFGVCWYQAGYLNHVLCLNNLRSENEMYIIRSIGERLMRDYDPKPVVFVSTYSRGPWINERVTIGKRGWNNRLYNYIVNAIFPNGEGGHYIKEKYIETNVNCGTEQYAALQSMFAYCGYDIEVVGPTEKPHTPEYLNKDLRLLREATLIAKSENLNPYQIKDVGKYLIVTLSNDKYILDMLE